MTQVNAVTESMRTAIRETERRRTLQGAYNQEHGITPASIVKAIDDVRLSVYERDYSAVPVAKEADTPYRTAEELEARVRELQEAMRGAAADLDTFYRLYAETSRRDGFLIRPQAYYNDGWGSFLDAGLAHLLMAEVEGEMVAGLLLFTFGPTAWYMFGASSSRYRRHMPNNLLQWEAMRQAKDAGCTLYDLWGAPDHLDESDPMWGVVRFKLGLGGHLARGLGAWDFPASRTAYLLYSAILPRYVTWLQRRHSTQPALQTGL